jgi:hypothetical protein
LKKSYCCRYRCFRNFATLPLSKLTARNVMNIKNEILYVSREMFGKHADVNNFPILAIDQEVFYIKVEVSKKNAVSSSSGYTKSNRTTKICKQGGSWLNLYTSSPFFKNYIPKSRKKNLKSRKNMFFRDRFILKFGFSKIYES